MSNQSSVRSRPRRPPGGYPTAAILHFTQPRNHGRMEDADGRGTTTNPMDGEWLEISCRLDAQGRRVAEARFRAVGCPALVAVGSVATELLGSRPAIKGLTLSARHIERRLGSLPELRRYCAHMGAEATRRAVRQALTRRRGRMKRASTSP